MYNTHRKKTKQKPTTEVNKSDKYDLYMMLKFKIFKIIFEYNILKYSHQTVELVSAHMNTKRCQFNREMYHLY